MLRQYFFILFFTPLFCYFYLSTLYTYILIKFSIKTYNEQNEPNLISKFKRKKRNQCNFLKHFRVFLWEYIFLGFDEITIQIIIQCQIVNI